MVCDVDAVLASPFVQDTWVIGFSILQAWSDQHGTLSLVGLSTTFASDIMCMIHVRNAMTNYCQKSSSVMKAG